MPQTADNPSVGNQWPSVPGILVFMLKEMTIGESDPCRSVVDTIRTECARCAEHPSHGQDVDWYRLADAASEFPNSPGATAASHAALTMGGYSARPETYFWTPLAAQAIMDAAKAIPVAARELKITGAFAACFNLGRHDAGNGNRKPRAAAA